MFDPSLRKAGLFAALFISLHANADVTVYKIDKPGSKYPFSCYASMCFDKHSPLDKRILDSEKHARYVCGDRDMGRACESGKIDLALLQQCRSLCGQARCKKTSIRSNGETSCSYAIFP